MFCKNCGKESALGENFCINCGTAFMNAQTDISEPAPVLRQMPKESWTKSRIIKTVIWVVIIGGLIFLKFGLLAFNSLDSNAVDTNNNALNAFESGNSQQAINQFQAASETAVTNENKINSLKNLAYVYTSENKNELALKSFKEALAFTNAESADFYLITGEIALLEGKPNVALSSYNKAYEKNPDEFQINNALNLFYLDTANIRSQYVNYPKALEHALKAHKTQPSEITKQNLAIAYYYNENYKQTISLLSSSNLNSEPYLAYWLGLAYIGDNQPVNAKYYLKMAIKGGVVVIQEITDYVNSN